MTWAARTITTAIALFALGCIAGHLFGCKPAREPEGLPAYCYDDEAFIQAIANCARRAPSRAASRACRADVHRSCGIVETVSFLSAAP